MTAPKMHPGPMGRPRSERMTEALRRVAGGETAYAVAKDMQIRYEYLCKQVKLARSRPG